MSIKGTATLTGNKVKKYDHAYTIAFALQTDNDAEHVTEKELLVALSQRLTNLIAGLDDIVEACGMPYDTSVREGF